MRTYLLAGAALCMCGCAMGEEEPGFGNDAGSVDGANTTVISCPSDSGVRSSNYNYILSNNCQPLQGVSVTVSITQDIMTTNGFSLQLNADGMLTSGIAWQQYVLSVDGNGNVFASVDNWNKQGQIFNQWTHLFNMPQTGDGGIYVPVGDEFSISLSSDSDNNITGASYTVVDSDGNVLGNYNLVLDSLNQYDGGAYASADIGPIGDFALQVVGFANGQNTLFLSGAGDIIYHSSSPLTVATSAASCVYHYWTGESSNSLYGSLPLQSPNGDYVQSFSNCQ